MTRNTGQPDSGAVDDSSQTLFERSELLEQAQLKLQGELDLGNSRHDVFPVLSDAVPKKSAKMAGRKTQARLRLVISNDSSGGYISGANSWRGTPDAASTFRTRFGGTRPFLRQRCTAWYVTPHLPANDPRPPLRSMAKSTTFMHRNLQLPVALRQQPRGVLLFPTMQPMVATSQKEREHFAKALNERVAKEHPETRGRPVWLHEKLQAYSKQTGRKYRVPSKQTAAYWLKGEKLPKPEQLTALCKALNVTRDELFGGSEDPRLALIVERWSELPEHMKDGLFTFLSPPAQRTGSE